VNLVGLVSWIS